MRLKTAIATPNLPKVASQYVRMGVAPLPNFLKPSELSDESPRLPVLVEPELVRLAPFGPIGRVPSWKPELKHLPAIGSQLNEKKEKVSAHE